MQTAYCWIPENVSVESIKFPELADFFELSSESDRDFEYTAAWIDCMARGKHLGRGLFIRENHAADDLSVRGAAQVATAIADARERV